MQTHRSSLVAPTRDLKKLIEKTKAYIRGAKAPATNRAYRSDLEDFTSFCRERNLRSLPATPSTVALYISDRAGALASATITRRLTSVTKVQQAAAFAAAPSWSRHFIVGETLKGSRRAIGTKQIGKAPLLAIDIRRIIDHCPDSLLGIRDRALVLVGFAGAFRGRNSSRSNLPISRSPNMA